MVKFKPGDVVRYKMDPKQPGIEDDEWGMGIVARQDANGDIHLSAWRFVSTDGHDYGWIEDTMSNGMLDADARTTLHPDADQVLADFTAWKLLNG